MLWTDLRRLLLAALIVAVIIATLGVIAERQTPVAGQTKRSAETAPPLRWAADAEGGAPYIFKDPDDPNRNVGFEVDLAVALGEELRREIEFVQYHFDELVPGLERGDYDFAMNGLEITPDRAARVRFSRPYYIYKQQLVVRADEQRFATLDECKATGAVVGTLGETAAERLLDKLEIEKRVYDGQVEPYLDLELGRIDAVLLDLPIAVYYARPNPKLKYVGEPTDEGYYAIAFRPEDEALACQVDDAIVRLVESGRLKSIYQKWHIWNDDQLRLADEALPVDVLGASGSRWTFGKYFPILAQAAVVTVEISVMSMMLAMALALPISISRLYGPAPLRWLATVYVEFFRGIPVLLLLYFLYYGLPTVGAGLGVWSLKLSPMAAAVLGFGLNYAAYEAEIYRAGILAIPSGQWEAAASLGMRPTTTFRRIIVPQAVRIVLPPVTNDFVALFKDTSLVSVIAVVELTKQYQMLAKSSLKYLEIGLATAALYLVMSVPLGYLSRYLERRWGRHV